jgi:3-deoxy-manno-octulosonate cytidylyltransferase (CMP-KDO synthetase)
VADLLAPGRALMATLCTPMHDSRMPQFPRGEGGGDPTAGRCTSAVAIPMTSHSAATDVPESFRHVGLYAYRVGALRRLAAAPACPLEITESLEQLRALWLGLEIRVAVARDLLGPDVDTPDDLDRAAEFLRRAGGVS